jgi:enoyl-CoA hydratase
MTESSPILLAHDGAVSTLTVSRPAALNSLDRATLEALAAAIASLHAQPQLRCLIVTGAGDKAFVAGADIAAMSGMSQAEAQAFAELGQAAFAALESLPVPVIAAVNGFALGGGCELALACDFVYASEAAKFGQPEVKLGIIPGFGGTQRLARRVGIAKAKELCMTGDMIDAAEALRIGLCDAVWPAGELLGKARDVAGRIAANGPLAVAEVKRLVHQGQSATLEHAIGLEQRSFGLLFASADQREGMSAFLAKPRRAPQFKGE